MSYTKYVCDDCGREIDRKELENSPRIKCPDCGSYEIRKLEEGE